jgi:hypothetical protein
MAAGTITFIPPALGRIVVAAGGVQATIQGNNVPANQVGIETELGAVTVPPYTMPLPPNAAYTFQHNLNGDVITVVLSSSPTGALSWQAAATPAGGTEATGSGNL